MDVEIYIFSAFPVFSEPHLCPKVNLGSSHFAKSSIDRQFFLEIALEKNSYWFYECSKCGILTQPAVTAAVTLLTLSPMEKKMLCLLKHNAISNFDLKTQFKFNYYVFNPFKKCKGCNFFFFRQNSTVAFIQLKLIFTVHSL